jgi:hypothetical protein
MNKGDPKEIRTNLSIAVLLQAVVYSGVWLWNDYVATYFTVIIPGIIFMILVLATVSDFIEPARIPKWYYGLMLVSMVTPIVIGAIFYYLYDGRLDWLT